MPAKRPSQKKREPQHRSRRRSSRRGASSEDQVCGDFERAGPARRPPVVPDAELASTSLTESASGTVVLKISCPAAESSCAGTVTLRTLERRRLERGELGKAKAAS